MYSGDGEDDSRYRPTIWTVVKAFGVVMFLVFMYFSCANFIDEQGAASWWYRQSDKGAR